MRWVTALERDTLGFNVWRSATGRRGDAIKVSKELIAATGSGSGATYELQDIQGAAGDSYWLEERDVNGASSWYGSARVMGSAPVAVVTLGGVRERAPEVKVAIALDGATGQIVIAGDAKVIAPSAATLARPIAEMPAQPVAEPAAPVALTNREAARVSAAERAVVVAEQAPQADLGQTAEAAQPPSAHNAGLAPIAQTERSATMTGGATPRVQAVAAQPRATGVTPLKLAGVILALTGLGMLTLACAAGALAYRRRKR